jgi:surface protein
VPGAFAAPFADLAELKLAVDSCLDPTRGDPTGVACCSKPWVNCGPAGAVEMADWDVSQVTSMNSLFYNKGSFNADISRWDTSSVTNMVWMFRGARAFNQDIGTWDTSSVTSMHLMFYQAYAFNQHLSRWDVSSVTAMREMFYDANAFNTMPEGWDTSKVTDSYNMFSSADAWKARFTGGNDHTLPGGGWTRKDNACDASYPPLNGAVGSCTDTLVSGTSCMPYCDARYVRQGVTSCTDKVLTEAVCIPDVATRAELKAAVDACVGDQLCEGIMPHWDVSRVTDMSFLFQGKSQFNVDISQWEMSQVTNVQGMFEGAASFYRDISGWTLADNANTTGMFMGADTWLSRGYRTDGSYTTDGPPSAWNMSRPCLENERVLSSWCVACGAGKYNGPGDDPALGVDTECDGFGTRDALKAAVDNCIAVDSTGVACCSHGADCGAAGTAEMADWDVSLVTSMSELFNGKGQFNADISRWDTSSVTNMYRMFREADAFNQDIGTWDTSSVTTMYGMFVRANAFNQHLSRWDVSSVTTMRQMFYDANAFNTMPVGWDTSKVTDSREILTSAAAWYARFQGGGESTLPGGGWTRIDDACDASLAPVNGAVGTCTDTLMSGTSCVPKCGPYYVLEGVTSCTDQVLTEAVCTLDVTTRAELKAAVDACVGDRLCEMTMPHWDVSRVTDMSFLFQGKSQFNVDIGQWEMSQVTNVQGMFHGAARFDQNISQWEMSQVTDARGMFHGASRFRLAGVRAWTFADGANTTGMFTGALTWLALFSRGDGVDTTDGPPGEWTVQKPCPENERVENGVCAPCSGGGTRAAGDDPALGVDTGCTFPDRTALKTAVDNCIAVDPTGVACCNHGADCGAAGTVEMPDWDVSLVTDMSSLFSNKGSFTADISRWDVSSVTTMAHMFSFANRFNADISQWDVSSVTTMNMMFRSNWWFNAGDKGVVVLPNFSRFYLFSEGPHGARLPCF